MKWPEYFPQDCPPDDAREASDRVYRFIEQDRPTPEDFLTVRELYPTRKFPETEKECRACAISVFASKEDLRLTRRFGRFRNAKIAIGYLTPEAGILKHTPTPKTNNSHHSWWTPIGVEPWTFFQIVDPNE